MSTQNPNPRPHDVYEPPPIRPARPFYRPANGKVLGGVCAAVADYFGWDRTVVRLLTVASVVLPGPQVLAYIVLWLLVPSEGTYWARRTSAAQPQGFPQQPPS